MNTGDIRSDSRTCRAARKFAAAAAAALLLGPGAARAAEGGPYDIFAKALAPIAAAVFGPAAGQPGAMVAELAVTGASGKLAAAQGARLRLALQSPDRLRADLAHSGALLTACRDGRELWAAPPALMSKLAEAAGLDTDNTKPDAQSLPLVPLALDAQMLAFLPVVFDVKDLGTEEIAGVPHRVLQFGILPELRKAMQGSEFDARAWIADDFKPRRVVVTGPDYSLDLAVDKLTFAEKLPPAAWQPAEGQDVLRLPASSLNALFEKMLAEKLGGR